MVYKETYNLDKVGLYYKRSIKSAKNIFRLFIQDRFGIKLKIYKLLEKILHKNKDTLSCFSTSYKYDESYLNLNHNKWNHPCTRTLVYTKSFEEQVMLQETKAILGYIYLNFWANEEERRIVNNICLYLHREAPKPQTHQ